jgi:hypothetical protein
VVLAKLLSSRVCGGGGSHTAASHLGLPQSVPVAPNRAGECWRIPERVSRTGKMVGAIQDLYYKSLDARYKYVHMFTMRKPRANPWIHIYQADLRFAFVMFSASYSRHRKGLDIIEFLYAKGGNLT